MDLLHCKSAELLAAESTEKGRRKPRPGLALSDRRCLAHVGVCDGRFTPTGRVGEDGVALTQILEERGGLPANQGRRQHLRFERVPLGDDVLPSHDPRLFGFLDHDGGHDILHARFIRLPRPRVRGIRELPEIQRQSTVG